MVSEQDIQAIEKCIDLCDLILNGARSERHAWLIELSESLRLSSTTPVNLTFGFSPGSRGYHPAQHNSLPQLLTLLRDCMLHMRYAEATDIIKAIVVVCRTKMPLALEIAIHRCMLETMYCLDGHVARVPLPEFVNLLKHLHPLINPKQIDFEHFIYLMTTGKMSEAAECLSSSHKSKRSIGTTEQSKYVSLLFRAYKGLFCYLQWEEELRLSKEASSFARFGQSQRLEELAECALAEFQHVTEHKGVWDVFITKQVALLVYLRKLEKGTEVLTLYRTNCYENPNSHRYLIDFLKQHFPEKTEQRLQLLKEYCNKWPSDKTMTLELMGNMTHSSLDHVTLVAKLWFGLLDFSVHKTDLELWKTFDKWLEEMKSDDRFVKEVTNEWMCRKTWWTPYHFNLNNLPSLNEDLCKVKASIFRYLKSLEYETTYISD